MTRVFALLSLTLLGCNNICPERVLFTTIDGGVQTCVVNTDCPRPSNVLVCGQTEDQLRDCIACENTQCVRYRPLKCP